MATVTKIPASRFASVPITERRKRKVAGYARVSTDHDEQFTSYEAQVDYYTNYIKSRDDWEFVGIYTDEGISGTNTKKREGFKTMIADALDGRIDLIVTKSVSRFARNTVDSLTTIRELKEHGTEVYFEKENIFTFDGKGELLLTIMSSLAQEESRSISENVTWGHRKRFADGKAMIPFGRFLGYERGEDGNLVVNKEQAVTVRLIYKLFLEGYSPYKVAKILTEKGIPTPTGKEKWGHGCVRSILTNEKYKGDALLQKCFTTDFLTKKRKKNEGEIPQYYVTGNHEAIIDPTVFELVQAELLKRDMQSVRHSGVSIYSSKIKCGECGSWYGSKVWHSNDKYRRIVYFCNHKYDGKKCETPALSEEEIQQAFIKAVNAYLSEKDKLLGNAECILEVVSNTSALVARLDVLATEINTITEQTQNIISKNATRVMDQKAYQDRYNSLASEYDAKKEEYDSIELEISSKKTREVQVRHFVETIRETGNSITEFDTGLWCGLVDYMTVYSRDNIKVKFKDGTEI